MLIEFRLRNYRCFRDEQILSMVATSDSTHSENLIDLEIPGIPKLLRSAVVYGANGSGKTTLLTAFNVLDQFVTRSFIQGPGAKIPVSPFAFDEETIKSPTDFEVIFIKDNARYQYGFSVDERRVYKEWLYGAPNGREGKFFVRSWNEKKKLYDYDWGKGNLLKGEKEIIRAKTRENALFLTTAAFLDHPQMKKIYEWFTPGLEGWGSNEIPLPRVAEILGNEEYKKQLLSLLKSADLSIEDFSITEKDINLSDSMSDELRSVLSSLPEKSKRQIKVTMYHKTEDDRIIGLDWNKESKGTRRLFEIGAAIIQALHEECGVVYVDEIDSSLHPLLSRAIIQTFHNPKANYRNVQLIFNTHDTTLLDPELFRRDQIWFTERKQDYSSTLYPLSDFRPRKEESLAKNYLQGRYGAIPFIGDLASKWIQEGE